MAGRSPDKRAATRRSARHFWQYLPGHADRRGCAWRLAADQANASGESGEHGIARCDLVGRGP